MNSIPSGPGHTSLSCMDVEPPLRWRETSLLAFCMDVEPPAPLARVHPLKGVLSLPLTEFR